MTDLPPTARSSGSNHIQGLFPLLLLLSSSPLSQHHCGRLLSLKKPSAPHPRQRPSRIGATAVQPWSADAMREAREIRVRGEGSGSLCDAVRRRTRCKIVRPTTFLPSCSLHDTEKWLPRRRRATSSTRKPCRTGESSLVPARSSQAGCPAQRGPPTAQLPVSGLYVALIRFRSLSRSCSLYGDLCTRRFDLDFAHRTFSPRCITFTDIREAKEEV